MKYPKLVFRIDLAIEKNFFGIFPNGHNQIIPELKFLYKKEFRQSRKKFLGSYLDNFFDLNKKAIEGNLKETEYEWKKHEKYFYRQVDEIFNNYPWPKGHYRAYPSLWGMFPRFIKTKEFTFPAFPEKFNKNFSMTVIAHEMLHFIMYDYLSKRFDLKEGERYDINKSFWCFTENFNVLIENEKIWKPFYSRKSLPYKDCEKYYLLMKKIWDRNKDLDNLIRKFFKL